MQLITAAFLRAGSPARVPRLSLASCACGSGRRLMQRRATQLAARQPNFAAPERAFSGEVDISIFGTGLQQSSEYSGICSALARAALLHRFLGICPRGVLLVAAGSRMLHLISPRFLGTAATDTRCPRFGVKRITVFSRTLRVSCARRQNTFLSRTRRAAFSELMRTPISTRMMDMPNSRTSRAG